MQIFVFFKWWEYVYATIYIDRWQISESFKIILDVAFNHFHFIKMLFSFISHLYIFKYFSTSNGIFLFVRSKIFLNTEKKINYLMTSTCKSVNTNGKWLSVLFVDNFILVATKVLLISKSINLCIWILYKYILD